MANNCWELLDCGRVPGGKHVDKGICPVFTESQYNGVNHGHNGGRICWAVSGTFCKGEVQGSFAQKKLTCMTCPVYKEVKVEENKDFILEVL